MPGSLKLRLEFTPVDTYFQSMMTATINSLYSAAMALDDVSRRDLAERLWEAVQPKDDSVFSEETWQEIGRRVTASDAGQVEHVPGDVALAQVRAEFGLQA